MHLIAKHTGERILLRWAPTTPGAWALSNRHGYRVERMLVRDTVSFMSGGYTPIGPDTLRPWPLAAWEPIANEAADDPYAAIVAQALYGDRYELTKSDAETTLLAKATEFNNLHAAALLGAEFSAPAARAAALRYEDTDIDTTALYLYRVYSFGSSEAYPIDTAYAAINVRQVDTLPTARIDRVIEGERHVELRWERALNSSRFSAYYVERSADKGRTYTRLTRQPYLSSGLDDADTPANAYYRYTDSVSVNYVPYRYRLIGITPFAELSRPSAPVTGMGRDRTPPPPPYNLTAEQTDEGQMTISWEYLDDPADAAGFYIARSPKINEGHQRLNREMIPLEDRSYVDDSYNVLGNNFYYIGVIDTAGNGSVAPPVLGNIVDSIPCAAPVGLRGSIDSSGVVTLEWDPNTEIDLIGYMVHAANQSDHVYSNMTDYPVDTTFWQDTIPLKVLTEHIYYKVLALDYNFNYSEFSIPLELKKPDLVPPASPIFKDYRVEPDGIRLTWIPSGSHDVVSHTLSRRALDTPEWTTLWAGTDRTSYVDNEAPKGHLYEYRIRATDDAEQVSPVAFTLTLKALDFAQKPRVEEVQTELLPESDGVRVRWSYPVDGDYHYLVYRAVDGGQFVSVEYRAAGEESFTDRRVKAGSHYEYAVRVKYADGSWSAFSPYAEVKVP